MTLKEQEDAIMKLDEEMAAREERDSSLAAAAMRAENERVVDQMIFTSEAFRKAFADMDRRKQLAGGPVRCRTCDDSRLVESLYDSGPGGAPCFEPCPNLNEPWHVKR